MLGDETLQRIAADLAGVPGVVGVVLGGSRARGDAMETSDVDLGVYYAPELDLEALGRLATAWHGGPVEVHGPGRWGPWVDGGAWLEVDDVAVDWILRRLDRVAEQCARAERGEYAFHPQAGHPLDFLNVAYAGELALGVPLADPVGAQRGDLDADPPALARSLARSPRLWPPGVGGEVPGRRAAKGVGRATTRRSCSRASRAPLHLRGHRGGRGPDLVTDICVSDIYRSEFRHSDV